MSYSVSFWEADTYLSTQDYIIVGAGLMGLWTAYELKQSFPKAAITIIERGTIPVGASTRNAGFACFGSPTELLSDMNKIGEEEMLKLVEMRFKGIEKIRKIVGESNIDFDNCGGYECLTNEKHDISYLEEKVEYLNKALYPITKCKNTYTWCNDKIEQNGLIGFDGMLENKLEGGLHSGKLVIHLAQIVQSLGVQILWGAEIINWQSTGDNILVQTKNFHIKSSKLILSTNSFKVLNNNNLLVKPARGQVLLTAPISALKLKGTYHFDEGFYYFRNVNNRILLGGGRNTDFEGEETWDMSTSGPIQNNLQKFLNHKFMDVSEIKIEYRWSGIMGFTTDKKPTIFKIGKNVYSVFSCNGMGVALSPIMAEILVQEISI